MGPPPKNLMHRDQILDSLTRPELGDSIATAIAAWPDASEGEVQDCVQAIRTAQQTFADAIREIDDDGEIATVLAINYIELKSRWIALNTKINYQTFRTGRCNASDALCATATSMLLQQVETLIDQADIDKITAFLAQPVSRAF